MKLSPWAINLKATQNLKRSSEKPVALQQVKFHDLHHFTEK